MLPTNSHGKASHNSLLDSLLGGFEGVLGDYLLSQELPLLQQEIRRFHGETLLWLGFRSPARLGLDLSHCMVRQHFFGNLTRETANASLGEPSYVGRCDALPLARASVESVVCHHGLECLKDPRSGLRELSRVLEPGGRLLLLVCNPYSLWGLRRLYGRLAQDIFTGMHFISPFRARDWLRVLGFDVDPKISSVAPAPPLEALVKHDPRGWHSLTEVFLGSRVPLGGAYLLKARKRDVRYILPKETLSLKPTPTLTPAALVRKIPCQRVA